MQTENDLCMARVGLDAKFLECSFVDDIVTRKEMNLMLSTAGADSFEKADCVNTSSESALSESNSSSAIAVKSSTKPNMPLNKSSSCFPRSKTYTMPF